MTIGERIKKLRREKDLTQEKMADLLGVSYQAISKWECGLSNPDLGLIVPLARLLEVSTDELLGATPDEGNNRRKELEDAYDETFKTGDADARVRISEEAVRAFPGDMMWLNRYAWDVWGNAVDTKINNSEEFEAEREKAIKLFDTVIRNTDDDSEKAHAIEGITQCLCGKGQKEEARRYVEFYPAVAVDPHQEQRLLAMCMSGDEQLRTVQGYLHDRLCELIVDLLWHHGIIDCDARYEAAEGVLKAMIPDENYLAFHDYMYHIRFHKAERAAKEGKTDDALEFLKDALYHAEEADRIVFADQGEYTYTAPLFRGWSFDSSEWFVTGTGMSSKEIKDMSRREVFDGLRGHPLFRELFGE